MSSRGCVLVCTCCLGFHTVSYQAAPVVIRWISHLCLSFTVTISIASLPLAPAVMMEDSSFSLTLKRPCSEHPRCIQISFHLYSPTVLSSLFSMYSAAVGRRQGTLVDAPTDLCPHVPHGAQLFMECTEQLNSKFLVSSAPPCRDLI